MASTPMQVDSPNPAAVNGLNGSSRNQAKVSDVITSYAATKMFRRDHRGAPTTILSLDFDDSGEFLMSSESDESIQIYNVKEGKHSKSLLSKKYGVKLARFSHNTTSIIYASTKENDALRYLSTHDNSFIRYFKGHEGTVTCIAPNPGADTFLSCSADNTVRLWDFNSENCAGKLNLASPYLAAFDPSASVIAIASEAAQTILLYDFRNFDKEPFASFDILSLTNEVRRAAGSSVGWNKLEFSNDGKSLLVGTKDHGHFLLDAFDGKLKSFLHRAKSGPLRLAPGQQNPPNIELKRKMHETSGDACFSPDGRYVISGQRKDNILVWDTLVVDESKVVAAGTELEYKHEAGVVAFNPRFNLFASGDREVVLWMPDLNALS